MQEAMKLMIREQFATEWSPEKAPKLPAMVLYLGKPEVKHLDEFTSDSEAGQFRLAAALQMLQDYGSQVCHDATAVDGGAYAAELVLRRKMPAPDNGHDRVLIICIMVKEASKELAELQAGVIRRRRAQP